MGFLAGFNRYLFIHFPVFPLISRNAEMVKQVPIERLRYRSILEKKAEQGDQDDGR